MLNNIINIEMQGKTKRVKEGTKIKDIIEDKEKNVLAVKVNNSIHSIYYKLVEDAVVSPITFSSEEGKRIYSRTLKFIFLKACYNLGLDVNKIEFTNKLQNNYYVRFRFDSNITSSLINTIKEEMWKIILDDTKITKIKVSYEKAKKIYQSINSVHQLDNFKIKVKDSYTFYKCSNYLNYLYGLIAPSTGYIKNFDIYCYTSDTAIISLPDNSNVNSVTSNLFSNNIFEEFLRFKRFQRSIGVSNVSDINMQVLSGSISKTIVYSEAEHNRRIVEIVSNINKANNVKVIFIAGPSSSGKTTFSQKLEVQLKITGKDAIHISMDNYFNDLENIPVVNGQKAYDSFKNLDINLFSSDMKALLKGKSIILPEYNFKLSKKEFKEENRKCMNENDILIIEGIHALNPIIHELISEKSFKIYLAPLVTLGFDNFTKISSNDTRLIRRIVRDFDVRGVEPENTLKEWQKVLKAEKENIFVYIGLADEIFNTSLVYELGVLKSFAEKLLLKIPESSIYFSDARRLYKLLNNFLPIETNDIPTDSIIKEFIGSGCFNR